MNKLHNTLVIYSLLLLLTISLSIAVMWGCATNPPTNTEIQSEAVVLAANAEIVIGENRFSFVLFEATGQTIHGATVGVRFHKLDSPEAKASGLRTEAEFRQLKGVTPHIHLDGAVHFHEEIHGFYVVDKALFHVPGIWQAQFEIIDGQNLSVRKSRLAFEVLQSSKTLMIGESVPPSLNPTSRDVKNITEITTHSPPLLGMYDLTIAEALERRRPFVVAFSTPSFCTSRMCGPVTDVVAQVARSYDGHVDFIHIEPWKLSLARSEGRLELTEIAQEWQLPSEPWVFVIDSDGLVSARFDGLFNSEELIEVLEAVLTK